MLGAKCEVSACFSPKTLADPLSLVPRTLRLLTEWGIFTVECLEYIWYDLVMSLEQGPRLSDAMFGIMLLSKPLSSA